MDVCTIKLRRSTKKRLDRYRQYRSESYDEVVNKLAWIADTCQREPKLSQQTIKDIEKARAQYRRGDYVTLAEMKTRLGL